MDNNYVQIKDLKFSYKENSEQLILDNVSMKVNAGDFVCLLGQSGCGKSTLLRLLAGLEKANSGSIIINGNAVAKPGLDRAVVFQDYGLYPWMTAGDNIILALHRKYPQNSKAENKKCAIEMLNSVGLSKEVMRKLPKELSGGMKQRCAIARAIAIDSQILLMDEPFGALDAVTRAKLQDLILDLWKRDEPKKTVFFVTHDVDEALLLANKIFVLGQRPSHVIYDCEIPEEMHETRANLYKNEKLLELRNTLIRYINQDVSEHVV